MCVSLGWVRSASVVMAWLMASRGLSLRDAVQEFTVARGRPPACSPTYVNNREHVVVSTLCSLLHNAWTRLHSYIRAICGMGEGVGPEVFLQQISHRAHGGVWLTWA
jgi:hypothetical protein